MSNSDSPERYEKKTERLDVRLSNEKKHAFTLACENQSDTPSRAVRRFINSYIRRSNRDDIEAALRFNRRRKPFFILGGVVTLIVAAVLILPFPGKTAKMTPAELFKYYDYDGNGNLELTEISANDHHLHRVLNIDGVTGISPDEFILHGTMVWRFTIPENWDVVENVKSKWIHKRVKRMTFPKLPEGTLIPTGDPDKPFLTVEEFKALGKPIDEIQQNLDIDPAERRKFEIDAPLVNASNYVIFDIRDPEAIQIDVLEQKSKSRVSKSLVFSRSVDWVRGRETPHYVMGHGADQWKSVTP